jgi:hypothetical protein
MIAEEELRPSTRTGLRGVVLRRWRCAVLPLDAILEVGDVIQDSGPVGRINVDGA